MQINNVSQTSNTAQTQNNTNTNSSNGSSFSLDTLVNKDPKEITFKEYQKLSKEDIEKLYSKEDQKEQYEQAMSLHTKANGTHDKILNEVLFDKEIASDDSKFDARLSHMIDFMIIHQPMLVRLELAMEKVDQYIKDNNIKFKGNDPEELGRQHLALVSKIEQELTVPEDRKIISKDEMFSVFKHNKVGAEANIEFNKYTPEDEQYQYYQAMISYEENIVKEYEKRVRENNATLASYTSNTSSAQQAIYQAEQKQTTKAEPIKEKEESSIETLRQLVEDIKSVLHTGFTVEELEHIEKLIAQIQKLMNDKNSNNDQSVGTKLKELEEELAKMQKRVNGEAIIEPDDKNKATSNLVDKSTNEKTDDSNGFQSRLDAIKHTLENMKSGAIKSKEELSEVINSFTNI